MVTNDDYYRDLREKNPSQKDCKLNCDDLYMQLSSFNNFGTNPYSFAKSLSATYTHFNLYGFFHLPGWENPVIYYFFHWPILVVFSGEEGLLFLKDHSTITAGVSWALVKSFFYYLFIVAPNQFLPLPCSENPWVFICKDFDLALLFAWTKNSCRWTESFRKWIWKGHILNKFRFYLGRIF